MKEKWLQLQQQLNGLNQRERALVFITALVAVVMLLHWLLLAPLLDDRAMARKQLKAVQSDITLLQSQQQLLQAELTVGVNRDKVRQQQRLEQELAALNDKIRQSVVAMIPPELMPEVLETLLTKSEGLTLLSLENKPVVAVLTQLQADEAAPAPGSTQALYNHGFVLQLSGDYPAIIQYFEELAALPWRFHWDSLHYQVEQYPKATIRLEVHTVSMDEEWIGV